MKHWISSFALAVVAAAALTACEGTMGAKEESESEEGVAMQDPSEARATGGSATTRPVERTTTFRGHPLDDPASPLSNRVVYFDFDSSTVREADRAVIEAHARYLAEHSGAAVMLEGHADERGTREYNIALGERRANAVRSLMSLNGAADRQLRTLSYGEERPVAFGHDEFAWRQNRRVEIDYRAR